MTKEKHDSSDSKRGDFYQPLVAIYYALNDQYCNFKHIVIEHNGDVSLDNTIQIEVKHHKNKTSLADTSEDFWKTLYNWINQKENFKELVLFTTSHFPKNKGYLRKWNKSNSEERFTILEKIIFSHNLNIITEFKIIDRNIEIVSRKGVCKETINKLNKVKNKKLTEDQLVDFVNKNDISQKEYLVIKTECKDTSASKYKTWNYCRFIRTFSYNELEILLSKITLKTNQPIDSEMVELLSKKPNFRQITIPKLELHNLIKKDIAGFIYSKVVGESMWTIDNKQFFKIIEQYCIDYYKINYRKVFDSYLSNIPDTNILNNYKQNPFVEELKHIECDDDEINDAIIDTWKTIELIGKESLNDPTFYDKEYVPYKNQCIHRALKKHKRLFNRSLENNKGESLRFYRSAIELKVGDYKSIKEVYDYFKHGTMQCIVDEKEYNFTWIL